MTEETSQDSDEGTRRRFHVELFIVHPTINPADITAELGLQASNAHRVGEPRKNPKRTLPGNYRDTRWRHSVQHEFTEQWFSAAVEDFVGRLVPHKKFLRRLRETGGKTSLIIQFFDAYYGDKISRATLAKLVTLELDLGIECFYSPPK